jgi:hypothetical protein
MTSERSEQREACIALTVRVRLVFDNISVTNNKYNMRKFNNTIEVVSFTVQVGLTTMFVVGFTIVLIALVSGNIKDYSFGMMG